MVLNKLRLAERQRTEIKELTSSFLTDDHHLFYKTSDGQEAEGRSGEIHAQDF